jgi:hypothetical protein
LPSAPAAISELSADNEVALELALRDSVKEGSPAELESYLEQYPEGTFASLARTRLDAAALSPPSPAPTPEEVATEALDLAFWNSVKDTRSARGASGLPGATSKWPLRRTRTGPLFFAGSHLAYMVLGIFRVYQGCLPRLIPAGLASTSAMEAHRAKIGNCEQR